MLKCRILHIKFILSLHSIVGCEDIISSTQEQCSYCVNWLLGFSDDKGWRNLSLITTDVIFSDIFLPRLPIHMQMSSARLICSQCLEYSILMLKNL